MDNNNNIDIKKWDRIRIVKSIIVTLLASIVSSLAMRVFVYPANFVPLAQEAVITMLYKIFDEKLNAGIINLVLNAPLIIYVLIKADKKYVIFTLSFTVCSSIALMLFESLKCPQYVPADVGEVSANYSTEIRSLLKIEKEVSSESVISLAFKFFSEILSDKCAYVDYVSAVKNYVENNYMNDVTAESIANAINLDRRYLSRIFKEKTGVGIKQYLIDYRLSKSIEYMKQGYNVTQSASMCGYFDLFNYSKIFKKNFGVSPKTFYQNLKKDSD